jgi:betaine-aldehyde dehydrogenase
MYRATVLHRLADAYSRGKDELIRNLTLENGKLRAHASYEVHFIERALRYSAGLAVTDAGRVAVTAPGKQSMSIRQPVGVAGIISPWNSPAYLTVRSLAPALAAGCTVAVKLPAQAAQTARVMAEILASVPELPAGVANIFIESGGDGARHLVSSPDVRAISFTGSTATGRAILQAAATLVKRVGAELGGKTPHVIFPDAALGTVVQSVTMFAGQYCMTGSRVLVHADIADAFVGRLAERLEAVRLGPAADSASEMGPMIDKAAVSRVDAMVEEAIASGANAVVRGGPAADPALAAGALHAARRAGGGERRRAGRRPDLRAQLSPSIRAVGCGRDAAGSRGVTR